jgi:hypothetical protein
MWLCVEDRSCRTAYTSREFWFGWIRAHLHGGQPSELNCRGAFTDLQAACNDAAGSTHRLALEARE